MDQEGRTGDDERSARLAQVEAIRARGDDPYPVRFDRSHTLGEVREQWDTRLETGAASDEVGRVSAVRFAAIAAARSFLVERGFVEVETPVLTVHPGSDAARPFTTRHNALDTEFSLRIAPELYLKRLVVGGIDRVFEIARVFRNEGLSTRHNPEFTMLELYEAFSDYFDMMRLTEELIADAARNATGGTTVEWDGAKIDLTPPFERRTMLDLVHEHAGVEIHPSQSVATLRATCDTLSVPWEPSWSTGKLVLEIYEKTTEANIAEPTFVCDYPRDVSPLARTHRDDPTLTERFELIVHGRELANAFSELNDPVEQLRRFEAQASLKQLGDEKAQGIEADM